MKQRFHIYLHTNKVNGKKYVGQTVDTVEGRWKEHVLAARHGKRGSRILGAAIRKYGADAFTHELLDVVTTQEGADIAETRWIEQRQSRVPNGYNLMSGGGGNGHHHEESKRLIGNASRAHLQAMTPEQRTAYFQTNIHIWTPERKAKHLKQIRSLENREKVAEGQKGFWAKFSPEEKSERVKHQLAGVSPERKSETTQKVWASMSPEARAERVRKAREGNLKSSGPERSKKLSNFQTARQASLTPEQKQACGQKILATRLERYGSTLMKRVKSHEEYSESTKRGWANMTPEARTERHRKILEGRLVAKAKLTPEQLAARSANKSVKVKEGLRRAKELRATLPPARQPNLLRFNLLPPQPRTPRRVNRNLTAEVLARAYAMQATGMSVNKIIAELRIPSSTLRRAIRRGKP